MRPSDAPTVDRSHDRYGTATPCKEKREFLNNAFNSAAHQCAKFVRAWVFTGSINGQARAAAAHGVLPAAARILRTHQPAGSVVAVALAEAVAQSAHQPHACEPAALAQRRQRVPLGALPRKVHVLRPHMPALVHPLCAEVVRRN